MAIAYVCLITFPGGFGVAEPGLDESWMWGLNAAHAQHLVFGRDVVFTYGPLGFLTHPRAVGNNLQWAAAFAFGLQAVLGAALGVLAWTAKRKLTFLAVLAGIAVACAFGLWEEYYYRIVLGLCLLAGLAESSLAVTICALAGALAALLATIKFNLTISVVSMLAAFALVVWLHRPTHWRRGLAALGVTFVLGTCVSVIFLFRGPGNFGRWVGLSWELASGYGSAMSVAGPMGEAVVGVLLAAMFVLSAVFLRRPTRIPLILFAIPVVTALKHGFVGHPMMATGYFTFLVAVASLPLLYAETRKDALCATIAFLAVTSVSFYKGAFRLSAPPITGRRLLDYMTGHLGSQNLEAAWNARRLTVEYRAEGRIRLAEKRLPAKWIAQIANLPGGVDALPWELSYLPANDLKWRPGLVLQHYSACTGALDRAVAEHLRSGRGPDALLVEFAGLYQRHILLDTPAALQTILNSYEAVETDFSRNLLLLLRRGSGQTRAPSPHLTPISPTARFGFEEWVKPPAHSGKLYARLHFRRNLVGVLRQFLWKTPPVYIRLEYASGRLAEFRILPDTAANGILINYFPATLQDLNDLFHGTAYDKVGRFQITGPGALSYRGAIDVEWVADGAPLTDYRRARQPVLPKITTLAPAITGRQAENLTISAHSDNGYRDLRYIQAIVNQTRSGVNSCYLSFEVDRRILWLVADRGSGSAAQGAVGIPEILENSTCAVNLLESGVQFRGADVVLHLAVAMKTATRVPRKIFATAIDSEGNSPPWKEFGSWSVPAGELRIQPWELPETPPSMSVETVRLPGHESFMIKVRIGDINGSRDVEWAQIIINELQMGRQGCYLHFDQRARTISLMNDEGTAYAGSLPLGAPGPIGNSYCQIAGAGTRITENARELQLEFPVQLSPKMSSKRVVYAAARDRGGMRLNWRACAALPAN